MKTLLIIQGLFYLLTGLWPLINITTFMLVTGPKTDVWLVKIVGLLVASSGLVFIYTGLINPIVPVEVIMLGVLNCLCLAAADIHYVRKKVISKVYLGDAFIELLIAGIYLLNFKGHP